MSLRCRPEGEGNKVVSTTLVFAETVTVTVAEAVCRSKRYCVLSVNR